MTTQELITLAKKLNRDEVKLLARKGADYSPGEDTLAIFKRIGERYGISPMLAAAIFMEKHLDAIRTYIAEGRLHAEGLEEHATDARNYLTIILAIDDDS